MKCRMTSALDFQSKSMDLSGLEHPSGVQTYLTQIGFYLEPSQDILSVLTEESSGSRFRFIWVFESKCSDWMHAEDRHGLLF